VKMQRFLFRSLRSCSNRVCHSGNRQICNAQTGLLKQLLPISRPSIASSAWSNYLPQLHSTRYLSSSKTTPSVAALKEESTEDTQDEKPEFLKQVVDGSDKDRQNRKIFAVVYIAGKQFKVTTNDIIIPPSPIDAECGDKIRLEKVLALGGSKFSLFGTPLLNRDLVKVEAVVLEKTRGEKKISFKKKRRKNHKRWKGHRDEITVLKIDSIDFDMEHL